MIIPLCSWRRKDPRTGRWRVLAWNITDEDAKRWRTREKAQIEKLPSADAVRTAVGGYGAVFFPAQSTEAIEQPFADLGAKPENDE